VAEPLSSALLTDHYELTMLSAALADGSAERRCTFEVFARSLPAGRRYGVVAGTGRLLDLIEQFTFGADELQFLRSAGVVDETTLDWLEAYRFNGDVWGYPEGELYFAGSPVLTVEATFGAAVILETLSLSVLNHDSAIASAAARMTTAAAGRRLVEMGTRRTHEEAAIASARAAFIAGFDATSNLAAGRAWGIPTTGTSAHAFVLLHDDEADAFASQVRTLGVNTTMLIDTYDIPTAVRRAVEVAGPGLGAVRVDSGDLGKNVLAVRALLDELGATGTRIVVTGDLDEFHILELAKFPVDAYGAGTALVTGSGAPTAGMVYKLTAVGGEDPNDPMRPVAKASTGKATRGGRKDAVRTIDAAGIARAEVVRVIDSLTERHDYDEPATVTSHGRGLLARLIAGGEIVGREPIAAARHRNAAALAELPVGSLHLSAAGQAIPTIVEG
jgi:nicotinate phosphoribosyltransferase